MATAIERHLAALLRQALDRLQSAQLAPLMHMARTHASLDKQSLDKQSLDKQSPLAATLDKLRTANRLLEAVAGPALPAAAGALPAAAPLAATAPTVNLRPLAELPPETAAPFFLLASPLLTGVLAKSLVLCLPQTGGPLDGLVVNANFRAIKHSAPALHRFYRENLLAADPAAVAAAFPFSRGAAARNVWYGGPRLSLLTLMLGRPPLGAEAQTLFNERLSLVSAWALPWRCCLPRRRKVVVGRFHWHSLELLRRECRAGWWLPFEFVSPKDAARFVLADDKMSDVVYTRILEAGWPDLSPVARLPDLVRSRAAAVLLGEK